MSDAMKVISLVDRFVSAKAVSVSKRNFDPIKFVSDVGALMISMSVHEVLGDQKEAEYYSDEIIGLVETGAFDGIMSGWDYSSFLRHYPTLKCFFEYAEWELAEKAEAERYYNHNRNFNGVGKVMVYCPRGCNCIDVSAQFPWDECAACGSRMTPRIDHYTPCKDSTRKLSLV